VTVVEEEEEEAREHEAERRKLLEVAAAAPEVGRTRVKVWRQRDKRGRVKRQEREAEVRVCAQEVEIQPPRRLGAGRSPVRAWLVRSVEVDPPAGEEPVEWVLLTTRPVRDGREAAQMVHWYALRWPVERLHYVLKSGCQIERLQVQQRSELEKVLALYWLVAWRVLWVTHLARERPEVSAEEVLGAEELRVLGIVAKRPLVTARDVTQALAKLAGAESWRNAPEPGAKRIWTGLRALDNMLQFYRALQGQDAIQG
jgi:Transposase DDE domain